MFLKFYLKITKFLHKSYFTSTSFNHNIPCSQGLTPIPSFNILYKFTKLLS
ncbi:unnamed protein product [Moneuplotes crassus]|uniref:Uncharacterized protein n=1 Tax=Euplotes crassus TaxID=5936 RepID=A0AAD1XXX8_EUPCR|nr:unnamed protein product [Moneuplotes crassus]